MKHLQLAFAREYRGYTQTQLSSMVKGLSQSNLSKFEKGIGVLSEEVLKKIMDVLEFPMGFLDLNINVTIDGNFRKKATIKASKKAQIERFLSIIAYMVDWMSDELEFPEFKFNYIDIEQGFSPAEIAGIVRRQFKLGNLPIRDIFGLLEANGIIVYQWDCDIKEFDGISILTDKGYPIIVINKNMSNDRKRFTLAHELGHTIMHQSLDFIISKHRDKEKEANDFASEFLMPELAMRSYLCNLTLKSLQENKRYWLTSMASILQSAKKIGIIEDNRYKNLMIELSRNGWRLKEPISVVIDKPVAIDAAYNLFTGDLSYSERDLSSAMMLPVDILKRVFNTKRVLFLPQ